MEAFWNSPQKTAEERLDLKSLKGQTKAEKLGDRRRVQVAQFTSRKKEEEDERFSQKEVRLFRGSTVATLVTQGPGRARPHEVSVSCSILVDFSNCSEDFSHLVMIFVQKAGKDKEN